MTLSATHKAALLEFRADPLVREMAQAPALAWPTFLVGTGYLALVAWCWYLIVTGQQNTLAVILAIGIAGFYGLTVVHEAAHGLVSRNLAFNDVFGSIVSATILPGLTSVYYRWEHHTHHRYLGDPERDLDTWLFVHPKWLKPITWLFTDYHLASGYLKVFRTRPQREKNFFYAAISAVFAVLAVAAITGHLWWVFLYWFIPSRIALTIYMALFGYMPHAPGCIPEREAGPFAVSKTILGFEWLLTPLLMFQNYHLIHHLIPTVPFYRYARIWRAKRDFLIAQGADVTYLGGRPQAPAIATGA